MCLVMAREYHLVVFTSFCQEPALILGHFQLQLICPAFSGIDISSTEICVEILLLLNTDTFVQHLYKPFDIVFVG